MYISISARAYPLSVLLEVTLLEAAGPAAASGSEDASSGGVTEGARALRVSLSVSRYRKVLVLLLM